jgi:hypothetical protein
MKYELKVNVLPGRKHLGEGKHVNNIFIGFQTIASSLKQEVSKAHLDYVL